MKRLVILLSLCLILLFSVNFANFRIEGLCGNYSLTYSKVKDIFKGSNISGMKQLYNTHYNRDLLLAC